jgi:hypothetical protein
MADDFGEMADELDDAASLCDDEVGEWWQALARMWPRVCDGASEEFLAAYKKELSSEHQRFKEEFQITQVTETQEVSYRIIQHYTEL